VVFIMIVLPDVVNGLPIGNDALIMQ
jgi:hypothetical protein